MSRHVLETYTGRYFDYHDPQPEQVCIEDIARALSQISRFAGHTRYFYSVAEHAVLVSEIIESTLTHRHLSILGLHHDDHEAYLGDIPTPLKNVLGQGYRDMVEKADFAIAEALNLTMAAFHCYTVRWADAVALRVEARALKHSKGLTAHWDEAWFEFDLFEAPAWPAWRAPGLAPEDAKDLFLAQHEKLTTVSPAYR